MTKMGIAQKLMVAAEACGYVQKDGNNAFHKYRYASAANILGHVNDALTKAGLAVVDTLPEVVSESGAGKDRLVTARMTITVADTETAERATFRGLGSGMDAGDKAVMKAVTAATKYAWMGAFSISTGDDPEADDETDKRTAQAQKKPADKPAPKAPEGAAAQGLSQRHADLVAKIDAVAERADAVKLWRAERATLAPLGEELRTEAWDRLCVRVAKVGKMGAGDEGRKAAHLWLRKALAEESARDAAANGGAQ